MWKTFKLCFVICIYASQIVLAKLPNDFLEACSYCFLCLVRSSKPRCYFPLALNKLPAVSRLFPHISLMYDRHEAQSASLYEYSLHAHCHFFTLVPGQRDPDAHNKTVLLTFTLISCPLTVTLLTGDSITLGAFVIIYTDLSHSNTQRTSTDQTVTAHNLLQMLPWQFHSVK